MKHIEDIVCTATHLSQGISRSSPLFNPTGNLGEQYVLCAPSKATVTEILDAFQKQQSIFSRATWVVNDTAMVKRLFKKEWKSLDVLEKYQDVTKPICVFTWKRQETSYVDEVFKCVSGTHTMKFKGQVNWNPVCVLMDTGASGTAFVDRNYCKDESVPLYPAPPDLVIVLGDNSRVPASHMATVTLKFGTYRFKVECLVVGKLPDYPLILGNPWLTSHRADLSSLRKQIVLKRPDGKQICLNAITSKPQSISETEPYLGILGDEPVLETTSDMNLLSTKKVVRMIKRDLLAGIFVADSIWWQSKGYSENGNFERADGKSDDPFAKYVLVCYREGNKGAIITLWWSFQNRVARSNSVEKHKICDTFGS
jgi:hypothetical protein